MTFFSIMAPYFYILNFCQLWRAIMGEDLIFTYKLEYISSSILLPIRISKQN